MIKEGFTRRRVLKTAGLALCGAAAGPAYLKDLWARDEAKAKVYFTKDLSPEGLRKIYGYICGGLRGKIAVKLHTGEPGGPNIIPREWVKALMTDIPSSAITETNVYYSSPRQTTKGHKNTLRENGWTFCPVDIMDAEGEIDLPVPQGRRFKAVTMGKNIVNYDSMLVLTHFKGHTMGGFGGSLKNIAIGCASGKTGKKQLHSVNGSQWGVTGELFMEHMAESGRAVQNFFGSQMAYVNIMRNMSVDCDCAGKSAETPATPDLGILASTDILALDRASVDMIYALPRDKGGNLVRRIESREGLYQFYYMKALQMGSYSYELIEV